MMGPIMAVLRPVLALVTGVMGGCLLEAVDRNERESAPADTAGGDAGCALPARGGRWRQAWRHGAVTLPADIGRPMLAGLLIAGVIAAFVPDDFFTGAMKSQFLSMLVMLAVGIPLYVCASASVPIAAVLILKGLSPGAALVFLIVGPATNAATVTTLWRILGRRATWVYLLTVSVTALLAGLVVNLFAPVISTQVQAACHAHAGGTHMAGAISAVVLIVLLLPGFIKFRRRLPARIPPAATRLRVKGMTCRHCAQTVEAAVRSVPGVATATVSLVEGLVWVEGRADISAVRRAIKAQGYDVAAE
jgi:copper chaperone CopZ